MLSFKEIKELIDLVAERKLCGVEIERAGFRLRIEGQRPQDGAGFPQPLYYPTMPSVPGGVASSLPGAATAEMGRVIPTLTAGEALAPQKAEEKHHFIPSPIVGTFYRSPSPESPAFVSVGDRVEKGKILCIIEAMKLMNEIESDVAGEVVEVFPQNGQPVEYGEKLFAIRLA